MAQNVIEFGILTDAEIKWEIVTSILSESEWLTKKKKNGLMHLCNLISFWVLCTRRKYLG